mmetsp:Transcript_83350/g.139291  ORF Transcript_83350/g.139291 Transcript_83350/m.139291 type:complete len:82 (+) Transcript_83350:90-335(+)
MHRVRIVEGLWDTSTSQHMRLRNAAKVGKNHCCEDDNSQRFTQMKYGCAVGGHRGHTSTATGTLDGEIVLFTRSLGASDRN